MSDELPSADVIPFGGNARVRVAMPGTGAGPDIIDLDGHRTPVSYTVRLKQWYDGRLAVWVQDVADTKEDRLRVAAALRTAADAIEDGVSTI